MTGYLDPELATLVATLPRTDISQPAAARARLAALRAARPPFEVPPDLTRAWLDVLGSADVGSADSHAVRVLAFRPSRVELDPVPAIVYFHGGGFVMGDAEGDQLLPAQLAQAAGAVVLSVDYRLAPEHPYPAAHDDGYAVLSWLATHADALGVDADRIAVAGSSAGAAIAAGLALRMRDEAVRDEGARDGGVRDKGGTVAPRLAAQLLEIPCLDDRAGTPSAQYVDTPMWNRTNILDSWAFYLNSDRSTAVADYAAPARAMDLAGLPPTYVGVCSTDPLRDEGIAYAQRLAHHGVATELCMYPGLFHGAAGLFPDVPACRRARAALLGGAQRLLCA